MRKQIAAANWKMNLSYQQAEKLLDEILEAAIPLNEHQEVIFAVPYPYLIMTKSEISDERHYEVAAQNCHHKSHGAYTGEISAEMLQSLGIPYCIVGHSERREYNAESNEMLAAKVDLLLEAGIKPIFCCGEPLSIREAGSQNEHVSRQLSESIFHLDDTEIKKLVIAYEPIWAIGTGKTASTDQAQEMHLFIRSEIARKYSESLAAEISILSGGSVKAGNAEELFSCPDVDGGLVGGAALSAEDFIAIINALK
jgi:triosephosphate isomerase